MTRLVILSGPVTTLLAPLFLLRAAVQRTRANILQALVVCLGGLVQIGITVASSMAGRPIRPSPLTLAPALFNKEIVLLFFSRISAKVVVWALRDHMHFSTLALLLTWIGLLLGASALFAVVREVKACLYLLLVAFWMATIEAMLGLVGGWALLEGGERYGYLPNVLIVLALILAATTSIQSGRRTAARVLLALAFCSGMVDYALLPLHMQLNWQGEPWRQQALRWEADPSSPLHGSPTFWPSYQLPPRN